MKFCVIALLIWLPLLCHAEKGTFEIEVIEMTEKSEGEYTLHFMQLSQPFGYKHTEDTKIILHLRFICPIYECLAEEGHPTEEKFNNAVQLLKSQIETSKHLMFGVVDRGYAKIEGTENEYQSNGLEIVDGIVYSDYDFFEF